MVAMTAFGVCARTRATDLRRSAFSDGVIEPEFSDGELLSSTFLTGNTIPDMVDDSSGSSTNDGQRTSSLDTLKLTLAEISVCNRSSCLGQLSDLFTRSERNLKMDTSRPGLYLKRLRESALALEDLLADVSPTLPQKKLSCSLQCSPAALLNAVSDQPGRPTWNITAVAVQECRLAHKVFGTFLGHLQSSSSVNVE